MYWKGSSDNETPHNSSENELEQKSEEEPEHHQETEHHQEPPPPTGGDNMLLKIVLPLLMLLLAAASICHFVYDREYEKVDIKEKEEKTLVGAVTVKEQTLEKPTSLVGTLETGDQRYIIPEIAGKVEKVHVEEGERVEEGQLLIELESEDYELQIEEARSAQRAAEAQLREARAGPRDAEITEAQSAVEMARESKKQAEKELERAEELYEEGFASKQQLEMAELEYVNAKEQLRTAEAALNALKEGTRQEQIEALQAQVDQAATAVEMAGRALESIQLEAPADGTLAVVDAKEGELLDTAAPAAVLIDTENMQVTAALPEIYVNQLAAGDAVSVEIPAVRAAPFEENIQRIGDLPPDEGSRSYPLEIVISKEEGSKNMKTGMYARVEATVEKRKNIPVLPRRALLEGEEEFGVYALELEDTDDDIEEKEEETKGTVKFVNITAGISEDGLVEVKEGLEKGDLVVADGQEEISPGDRVRVQFAPELNME